MLSRDPYHRYCPFLLQTGRMARPSKVRRVTGPASSCLTQMSSLPDCWAVTASRLPSGERARPLSLTGSCVQLQLVSTAVVTPSWVTQSAWIGRPPTVASPAMYRTVPFRAATKSAFGPAVRTPSSTGTGGERKRRRLASNAPMKTPPSGRTNTTRSAPTGHALRTSPMTWCKAPVRMSITTRRDSAHVPPQRAASADCPPGRPATCAMNLAREERVGPRAHRDTF